MKRVFSASYIHEVLGPQVDFQYNAPSRNYFCATEIAKSKKGYFLFPLVEMLLSPKGTKPLEEF